jgi:hypothetical protein
VVLTMHVVRQGGHGYYVDDLVPGRAEGSLVAGEEPGLWVGAAPRALGLRGRVEREPFAELLEGRHPWSGRSLGSPRGPRSAAGYDLTFSAGQFIHRTSRALDPHLHTHVVAANLAEGVDGAWSAVDSRRLFSHLGAAQALYHARLRLELGHRIGASWEMRPNGLGDVVGVDAGLRRLFSQRSASMDQYRFERGVTRTVASSPAAFHADRPEKNRSVTVEELRSEWRRRATELGFDLGDLTRAVGPHHDRDGPPVIDNRAVMDRLAGLAGHQQTLTRRHLVAVVASSAPKGADIRQIESLASHWLEAAGPPLAGDDRGERGPVRPERRWEVATVGRAVEARSPTPPLPSSWAPPTDGTRSHERGRDASAVRIDPPLHPRDRSTPVLPMAGPDRSLGAER